MRCETCGITKSKVLSTRRRDGVLYRRRVCENGHSYTTVEVHVKTSKWLRRNLPLANAIIERKSQKYERDMQIVRKVTAGKLQKTVALDLGVSEFTVCRAVAKYAPHLRRKSPAKTQGNPT